MTAQEATCASYVRVRNVDVMRAVVWRVAALFCVENILYSILPPLLPHYVSAFRLSDTLAGAMSGTYSLGLVLSCALTPVATRWMGIRVLVVGGLVALGLGSVAFGVASSEAELMGLRTMQGLAGGCIWAGSMEWLDTSVVDGGRGGELGFAFGGSIVGTLLGPALATVALTIGTGIAFTLVAAVAMICVPFVFQLAPTRAAQPSHSQRVSVYRQRSLWGPLAWLAVSLVPVGMLGVLVPLRITATGAPADVVAITFLTGATVGAVVSPVAGKLVDRWGVLQLFGCGLAGWSVCLVVLGLPISLPVICAMSIVGTGVLFGVSYVAGTALVLDEARSIGAATGIPAAMLAVGSVAETIGAAGGAAIEEATMPVVPFLCAAVACGSAAIVVLRHRATGRES
jgi:predicted MFS family arabinose efflux permease